MQVKGELGIGAMQRQASTSLVAASGTSFTVGMQPGASSKNGVPLKAYDSVLFFHGLNGLELAAEKGAIQPGTVGEVAGDMGITWVASGLIFSVQNANSLQLL